MAVRKLMQSERGLEGAVATLSVLGRVHRLLRKLKGEEGFLRNAHGELEHEAAQTIRLHDLIDHAQSVGLLGRQRLRRKKKLLGLAWPELPRMLVRVD